MVVVWCVVDLFIICVCEYCKRKIKESKTPPARSAYHERAHEIILGNWSLPNSYKRENLEVQLIALVRRDGRILKVTVKRSSGNSEFDGFAVRAVRKSNPLPPFPEDYTSDQVEIMFSFRPDDLLTPTREIHQKARR